MTTEQTPTIASTTSDPETGEHPSGGYYKFLSSRHVETTLSGSIRFGRLRYYQLLEGIFGDNRIGDLNEGRSISVIERSEVIPGAEGASERELLRSAAIQIDEGSGVTVINHRIIREIDAFIFCFSHGELEDLRAIMARENDHGASYDACIELRDIQALASRIFSDGIVEGMGKVKDLFHRIRLGKVSYRSNIFDFRDGGPRPGDAFLKQMTYSDQSEVRIALYPREKIDADGIFVRVGSIEDIALVRYCSDSSRSDRPDAGEIDHLFAAFSDAVDALYEQHSAQTEKIVSYLTSRPRTPVDLDELNKVSELNSEVRSAVKLYGTCYWALRGLGYIDSSIDFAFQTERMNGGTVTGLVFDGRQFLQRRPNQGT
jgi:hypothetical protein